jgi:hypothetical protein
MNTQNENKKLLKKNIDPYVASWFIVTLPKAREATDYDDRK